MEYFSLVDFSDFEKKYQKKLKKLYKDECKNIANTFCTMIKEALRNDVNRYMEYNLENDPEYQKRKLKMTGEDLVLKYSGQYLESIRVFEDRGQFNNIRDEDKETIFYIAVPASEDSSLLGYYVDVEYGLIHDPNPQYGKGKEIYLAKKNGDKKTLSKLRRTRTKVNSLTMRSLKHILEYGSSRTKNMAKPHWRILMDVFITQLYKEPENYLANFILEQHDKLINEYIAKKTIL